VVGTWDLSRTDGLKSTFTLCKIEAWGLWMVSLTMAKPIIGPFDTSIYALKDEDGDVLYVGKTVNPRQRFSQHIRGDTSGSGDIPELVRMTMKMEILDKCSKEKGTDRETYWYQHYKPSYNKMILGGADTTKTARQRYLDKHYNGVEPPPKSARQRYLDKFHNGIEPSPQPEPKTICECGKTWSIKQKECHLKQHREMSLQHLAWAAKSSNPCPAEP